MARVTEPHCGNLQTTGLKQRWLVRSAGVLQLRIGQGQGFGQPFAEDAHIRTAPLIAACAAPGFGSAWAIRTKSQRAPPLETHAAAQTLPSGELPNSETEPLQFTSAPPFLHGLRVMTEGLSG